MEERTELPPEAAAGSPAPAGTRANGPLVAPPSPSRSVGGHSIGSTGSAGSLSLSERQGRKRRGSQSGNRWRNAGVRGAPTW